MKARHGCASRYLLTILASLASLLPGQTPTGRISGVVVDPTGSLVSGARVQAVNEGAGTRTENQSSENGAYNLNFLNPGRYRLIVEATGFRRYERSGVVVETGAVLILDVKLELGSATESISVKADTPLLDTDKTSLSQGIENAKVANMPLASRRVGGLIQLLANVSYHGENVVAGWADFSLAGGRGRQSGWQLDGGTVTTVPMFTAAVDMNPPVESIEELRVEANGYPAELGRTTGGVILMTTKSGTNSYHGVLYEFLRNDAFDARRFFAPAVAPRKYHVFGGTLGGPIRKDRTHFFFSYEGTRRRDGLTRIYNVPTVLESRGDFSGSPGTLLDPLTSQPFPGKIIPPSRLDPVGAALARLYPEPNVPGAASGANNFRTNVVSPLSANNYVGRGDHVFNAKDRVHVRYLQYRGESFGGQALPELSADPNASTNITGTKNLAVGWFHGITNTLFHELRFGYTWRYQIQPQPVDSGIAGKAGLRGVDPNGMPRLDVTGLTSLGFAQQARFIGPVRSVNLQQNLAWFRGSHSLKFGGEWRRGSITDSQLFTRAGQFGFNDVATGRGFGLAALLLGWTNTATVSNGAASPFMHYFAAYLQDDWRVNRRLTLNLGLRWEMDTPWREATNQRSGFDPLAMNPVSGTPGVITFAGQNGLGPYAHAFDRNNFGPRVGFAWRPFGDKTVIRAAYGLVFGGIYDGSFGRVFFAGSGENRTFASSDNGITPTLLLRDGVPQIPMAPRDSSFGAVRIGERVNFSPDFAMPDQRNPYSHQYNFNIQRQLGGGLLMETGYLANLSHRIAGRDVNVNEIRPALRGTVQNQRLRPFPQFANVIMRSPNWGNSSYHAFSFKVERRLSSGGSLLSSYTWSKFIDDVAAVTEGAPYPSSGQQSYYARHLDKALSGSDQRHRWVTSGVYDVPFGAGRRFAARAKWVDLLAGGWTLGGLIELRSGLPFGVIEQTNRLNSFSAAQRSNVIGTAALPSDRPRGELVRQYFNTSAFSFPGDGLLGSAARSVGIGPGYFNVDTSLMKTFQLRERSQVQLRGELFNLLNRPNFSNPSGLRGAPAFGQISNTVNDGRFIQLGVRVSF